MTAITINLNPIVKLTDDQFYQLCRVNPDVYIKQLTRLTFLETVQLNRLHYFLSEVITVRFSHWTWAEAIGILIVYVLT